jgi:hypothetical protein
LWGEVNKVEGELFWCHGGEKLPPEALVNGSDTAKPFFLVSLPGREPNLHAIPLNSSVSIKGVNCLYTQEVVQLCNAGNRTKELTPVERILKQFKLKVNL